MASSSGDGAREVRLAFADARAFEALEFRLAYALHVLNGGRRARIGFASDVPRLSAAEAYEDYQQKGLFAPKGKDVYSLARRKLADLGFEVVHINPRAPKLPPGVDAERSSAMPALDLLIWMQPRRSTEPMLEATLRYLHGGGHVLLAAQHFNIQSRQYRGSDFGFNYWPQPQLPDVEHLYFPELSIELVRKVLFDELSTTIQTDTQITGRGASRDFEVQSSALPFLIRASAANFADDSLVTRNLGDQAFVWGSALRFDEEHLAQLGLRAKTLMRTSDKTWDYDWKGGWLPEDVLTWPPAESAEVLGSQALAVLFEGTFPRPQAPLALGAARMPQDESAEAVGPPSASEDEAPWPPSAPGKLLFFGGSELFKDARLFNPEFRADQLLINATCALALEPELARVATRRQAARGFDYVEPPARLRWRAFVLATGPVTLVALAAVLGFTRSRASRRLRDRGARQT